MRMACASARRHEEVTLAAHEPPRIFIAALSLILFVLAGDMLSCCTAGAQALRCLALAYKPMPKDASSSLSPLDEAGLTFIAMVAMHDPPRRECAAAIQMCRAVGSRGLV